MKINRKYDNGGGGPVADTLARLIEQESVINIPAKTTRYIPLPIGFDRYEVRTTFVQPTGDVSYVLSIFDKQTSGNLIYRSLEEKSTYDIVNVPCEDKDGTQVLHAYIENKSTIASDFRLIIKVTNFL